MGDDENHLEMPEQHKLIKDRGWPASVTGPHRPDDEFPEYVAVEVEVTVVDVEEDD